MKYTILRGVIDTSKLDMVEAFFEEETEVFPQGYFPEKKGLVRTKAFPFGYEFCLSELAFIMDEESRDILYNPTPATDVFVRAYDDPDKIDEFYEPTELILSQRAKKIWMPEPDLDLSFCKLIDLVWYQHGEELEYLVDSAIMGREYTESYVWE